MFAAIDVIADCCNYRERMILSLVFAAVLCAVPSALYLAIIRQSLRVSLGNHNLHAIWGNMLNLSIITNMAACLSCRGFGGYGDVQLCDCGG